MLKHFTVEELESLCCELAALPLALFTEDGLMRDSAEAKRARDKKWGVILDSIGSSLIVMTVEYYSIISTAGINLPHFFIKHN